MRRTSPTQSIATLFLVIVIAATLVRAWERLRTPAETVRVSAPNRPDLVVWRLPGCYELRVDPWQWTASADSTTPSVDPLMTPPTRVRLLPDSADQWRRALTTYRAIPLTGEHDARLAEYLRWFVRADTLWLVWSDGRAGGGIALRQVGDSLLGRARSFDRASGRDGTAGAAAWRLDCGTLQRRQTDTVPRR